MLLYVLTALLACIVVAYALYRRYIYHHPSHPSKEEEHHYTFKIE